MQMTSLSVAGKVAQRRLTKTYRETEVLSAKEYSKLYRMCYGDIEMTDLVNSIIDEKLKKKRYAKRHA
jgi:ribosomal protein L19E